MEIPEGVAAASIDAARFVDPQDRSCRCPVCNRVRCDGTLTTCDNTRDHAKINCKLNLKVICMRYLPVEEARKKLGKLVAEAATGEPVVIGRRGTEQAVLLSGEEYERLRRIAEQAAVARFKQSLEAIQAEVRRARISRKVVDEAIRAARRR
ncbi:MAG: type II toxin-antitoxin system Phd/YefM family antitoxin [Armatimonadota bacterium]